MPVVEFSFIGTGINALSNEEVRKRTDAIVEDVIGALTGQREVMGEEREEAEKFTITGKNSADVEEKFNQLFLGKQWSDGLPLVPPTVDRVEWMLTGTDKSPDTVLGTLGPRNGIVTVKTAAINGVMAGCRPEYMPVLIAVVKAVAEPKFNLQGVLQTTNAVSPMIIVNGPIADQLNINGGLGCLGPGWRANMAIGRALRLMGITIAGAWPGINQMSGLGKWSSYCIAEAEAYLPRGWKPLHVELGYDRKTSTVTVIHASAMHAFSAGRTAKGHIAGIANTMGVIGPLSSLFETDVLVLLGSAATDLIAAEGWTKDDVRRYLYETARFPVSLARLVKPPAEWKKRVAGPEPEGGLRWLWLLDDNAMVPVVRRPEDIHIIVGGALGDTHSAYFPGWTGRSLVTKEIELPAKWQEILEKAEKEKKQ